jgi:hypothetical protein
LRHLPIAVDLVPKGVALLHVSSSILEAAILWIEAHCAILGEWSYCGDLDIALAGYCVIVQDALKCWDVSHSVWALVVGVIDGLGRCKQQQREPNME